MFTIIISSFALLLSLFSIYLQFFRKRTSILCKLIGINYDTPDNKYDRLLKYSISNLGNAEILINDIEFLSGNTAYGRGKDSYTVLKYECKNYPFVLKPGEIKIIEIANRTFENSS